MGTSNLNLATLIGSRICHDLISPIGAIGNGLELMGMRGAADGIEMDLIARSAEQARARIAFYRLAFGLGGDGEIAQREIVPVLDDLMSGSRLSCLWTLPGPCPRSEVRLACLAIMCCETAMPYGGTIEVARDATGWRVRGRATRLLIDPALWSPLAQGRAPDSVVPAQVQFALLPEIARDLGTSLSADWDDGQVSLRF